MINNKTKAAMTKALENLIDNGNQVGEISNIRISVVYPKIDKGIQSDYTPTVVARARVSKTISEHVDVD